MASTNDQLIVLSKSESFRRRVQGFALSWAHTNLASGTAPQKVLAASILSNSSNFVTQNMERFTFSDNVMAGGESVSYDFANECATSTISDANLQSQVNSILTTLAG